MVTSLYPRNEVEEGGIHWIHAVFEETWFWLYFNDI